MEDGRENEGRRKKYLNRKPNTCKIIIKQSQYSVEILIQGIRIRSVLFSKSSMVKKDLRRILVWLRNEFCDDGMLL